MDQTDASPFNEQQLWARNYTYVSVGRNNGTDYCWENFIVSSPYKKRAL